MAGSERVTITTNCSAPVSTAMRFRYFAARWAGVHACIWFASSSQVDYCVGRKAWPSALNATALSGPTVKQPWIVRELQQRRSNFLRFRHAFGARDKSKFLNAHSGSVVVSQPLDISMAHMKSYPCRRLGYKHHHLSGAGDGSDALQISFRAILSVPGGPDHPHCSEADRPQLPPHLPSSATRRPSAKKLLCRCCCGAIALTKACGAGP